MSRAQKKCMIGSAGLHLLLLAFLFVGPLLASRQHPDDAQAITMVDLSKLTDGPTTTGGSSAPQAPPPAPTPPQVTPPTPTPPTPPAPVVEPPTPKPPEQKSFIQKILDPDPPKPEKPVVDITDDKPVKVKPQDQDNQKTKEKPKVEVAHDKVKVSAKKVAMNSAADDAKAEARAEAAAAAKAAKAAARARAAAVSRVLGSLENNLSSGTEVAIPGPGAATFMNYGEAVRIKYTDAWIPPSDVTDENAIVKVSVVIARDGSVVTAKVIGPSGADGVDKSVEQTLRRVKFIAPFPDGATDDQRTFIINFNLKAKRLNG